MSDASSPLVVELEGAIAHLRFNRPGAMNAIDAEMAESFLSACRMLESAQDIRVVVLSGEGRSFMAGGDLASFHQDFERAPETARAIIDPLHEALMILVKLDQPVIGCLHGAVAGVGVSIALACDLAIAGDDARFNLAYARIGACPDGSGSWSLPRIVGLRKAMELVLLSETVDATEALSLGLVNRVVPAASLRDETAALAARLAGGPTKAYGQVKQLLRAAQTNSIVEQMWAERDAFAACARSRDFAEGVSAFFEKRSPAFAGE